MIPQLSAVESWSTERVADWLRGTEGVEEYAEKFKEHRIDGKVLLMLQEEDLKALGVTRVGDIKRVARAIEAVQNRCGTRRTFDQRKQLTRLAAALGYCLVSVFATAFSLVTAHERVPLTDQYPPLPDLFLDNVPRVPWAFKASECAVLLLAATLGCVLVFHKARITVLTRFLAISATVFLLRCVTMLMTSLSVPGAHLECPPLQLQTTREKLDRALHIVMGLGSTVFGVETCGDYMFSGHCVALTLLGCFVCEYTPAAWSNVHRVVWFISITGIFCVVAAHEHYSIDCFVGFYISSRVFAYYHTIASQIPNMSQAQRKRMGGWFPLLDYFEFYSGAPASENEYELPTFVKYLE